MNVVMLAYPGMTQLDLTAPFEVFRRFREMRVELVWKTTEPIADGSGLRIIPSASFADSPQADILFVPGGPGQEALMHDEETLDFVRAQAAGATYLTSVCTGSLLLGAAGLLKGFKATCHWMSLSHLSAFGAEPVASRVVIDRDRVTGAGVTSGIDFALTLGALLFGEERARLVQLSMEYDPQPPFVGGSPANTDPALVEKLMRFSADLQRKREETARKIGSAMSSNTGGS